MILIYFQGLYLMKHKDKHKIDRVCMKGEID